MPDNPPIVLEEFFDPGFKTKPAVHVGSQTIPLFHGIPEEQAWEGYYVAGATMGDVAIARAYDPLFIEYWNQLMPGSHIVNILESDMGEYLTQVLLSDSKYLHEISKHMDANAKLNVFLPTELEEQLAKKLGIPLHGSPATTSTFGTKSGIRKLAQKYNLTMVPGFTCTTVREVEDAIRSLSSTFDVLVVKHDDSVSGYFSKKIRSTDVEGIPAFLYSLCGKEFIEGKDFVVVEGWLSSKASLCAHIEILPGKEPIICGAWQQIIDKDGVSYMGAGPLMLSEKAMKSFLREVHALASALQNEGALGSYGPDFLIADIDDGVLSEDECALIELNARIPMTAIPLELIQHVKGSIGNGFCAKHVVLPSPMSFSDIRSVLDQNGLLIKEKNADASGIVPFNIGLLPWGKFDIVVMAASWDEASAISSRVANLFSGQ